MKAIETVWGTVTADEDGMFLATDDGEIRVEWMPGGLEPFAMVVRLRHGGFEARWVDANGVPSEKAYTQRAAAIRCAANGWGC